MRVLEINTKALERKPRTEWITVISDIQDINMQSDSTPITSIMVVAGIIVFGGLVVGLVLWVCVLHCRPRQDSLELIGGGSSTEGRHRRTYVRRLSVVMFGDPEHHRSHDLPYRSDEKLEFGLEASVFENLPTFSFKHERGKFKSKEDVECCVCLEEFAEGEKGRILPKCGHCFHADCVDMWFFSHTTCPICRSEVKILEPLPRSAAGPRQSTTNHEIDPLVRFHPSGSSGAMGASLSFTGKRPSSSLYLDQELGQNGSSGLQISELAGRQFQQDGRSGFRPSITGSSSAEGIDRRDIHQPD